MQHRRLEPRSLAPARRGNVPEKMRVSGEGFFFAAADDNAMRVEQRAANIGRTALPRTDADQPRAPVSRTECNERLSKGRIRNSAVERADQPTFDQAS